jgi:hypothetical protein
MDLAAHVAQSVEHVLGKDEVTGSIPVVGSTREQLVAAHVSVDPQSVERVRRG